MKSADREEERESTFDFEEHGREALSEYLKARSHYQDLALSVERIIRECLNRLQPKINSVTSRAKDAESFEKKASQPSDIDPTVPKYRDPLHEITDLAGVRIITFFPDAMSEVEQALNEQFSIKERTDKSDALIDNERFGYQSVHFLLKLKPPRSKLPEFARFGEDIVEVQVRTILQHAWAEIEHDIQYKSALAIPEEINRRFMALAALLEIADREFQSIRDAESRIRTDARERLIAGNLDVEITPDSLKAYLDRKLGVDDRLSKSTYDWLVRVLKGLGFADLSQVGACIAPFDDGALSRITEGWRQGQATRFEHMLLAGMGETFLDRHPLGNEPSWAALGTDRLRRLREGGIDIVSYDPQNSSVE
jgi:putative GTP pyrophosphokinase